MSEFKKGCQEPKNLETSGYTHFITRRTSIHHVEKIYVDDESYYEWDRFVSQHRKKAQRCGECLCPKEKLWQCDTVCDECPFFNKDKYESLDIPAFSDDENSEMKVDYIADPNTENMEERIMLQLTIEHLIEELNEKEPELGLILSVLYEQVKTNSFHDLMSIARELNTKKTTFFKRIRKLQKIVKEAGIQRK